MDMSDKSMSQDVVKTTPSMTPGQIPDLLKIGSIQSNVQMSVDTDILDPVVQNSQFIRFVLQNKGILHSHSKLQFGYSTPAGEGWLPLNVGIAALIQRATLRIGNQTISEVDDFTHFQHYKSQFMSSESMRERLPYLTGQMMKKKVAYNIEGDQWSAADPPTLIATAQGGGSSGGKSGAAPTSQSHGLVIDSGRSFYSPPGAYEAQRPVSTMPAFMDLYKNATPDGVYVDTPTFQIALSDLFPFLKTNQLPLYMMKEQISLELVLHPQASAGRGWVVSGGTAAQSFVLDTSKTKMFADYQYYPQEMMMSYAAANRNLQFSHTDYRLSKLSFNEASTSQQIRNVGGAGRIITKVMFAWTDNDATPDSTPLIKWNATAPAREGTNVDTLPPVAQDAAEASNNKMGSSVINLKYNNGFLYPIDVDNTARQFHNMVQAEGLVPYVSREEYAREGLSLSQRTLAPTSGTTGLGGYAYSSFLSGVGFWHALRLNRGERVNSRGLELYWTLNSLPAAPTNHYTLRVYLETIKFTALSDGFVQSYLA
jgi:hypothetical protein